MDASDLVGVMEIAERLGVSRQLVAQWHRRGKLPEPYRVLGMGPIWLWSQIEDWRSTRDAPGGTE